MGRVWKDFRVNDGTNGQDWVAPGQVTEPALPDAAPAGAQTPAPASAQYAAPAQPQVVAASAAPQAAPTYRSWQPGIIPLRPVSFGEFLGVPFKAMRFNRGVVIGGPLLVVGASMLLLAAALWLAFTDPSLAITAPTASTTGVQASTIIVGIAALIALLLAEAIASSLVALGLARAILGERISVAEAFKALGPRLGGVLLVWLITTLASLLLVAPGFVLIIAGIAEDSAVMAGFGWLALFGLGLLSFPVYMMGAIARVVVVLERKGAIASIKRSIQVMRGRFWWSILIVLVTALIIGITMQVLQYMFTIVGFVFLGLGISGEWVYTLVFVIIMVVGSVITYVFTYAYMGTVYALIYTDARIRHEGFDLDLARAAEARRG